MALSRLLLGAPKKMGLWIEVGGSMIAIDTLVHNFLHRTGILQRFKAKHQYGLACYRLGGCSDIIQIVAEHIDARQFNPTFPQTFPGSSSRRSGATVARAASMSATATGSTTLVAAATWIAEHA
jgi:hypothetical protein